MNPIETLKHHNEWRRGSNTEMLNPTELGKAIDTVIADYEAMQKQNNELRAYANRLANALVICDAQHDGSYIGCGLVREALESTPAQSLADIKADAVIEAIEKCNANAQEEDNGERLIYVSDLIDHANRIEEG